MCESGQVIDWILSYAWHHEYLQHIPSITISGDVQPWVKEKWHDVFTRQAQYVAAHREDALLGHPRYPFAVYNPDIDAIATIGMEEDSGDVYRAEEFYPPKCTCKVGCWRLVDGKVEDELVEKSWDEMGPGPETQVRDNWDEDGVEGKDTSS